MTAQPLRLLIQQLSSKLSAPQDRDAFAVAEHLLAPTALVTHAIEGSRQTTSWCGWAGQASLNHPRHGRALGMECCSIPRPVNKVSHRTASQFSGGAKSTKRTYVVQGCPSCGRMLRTHIELLGEWVGCHHCGGEFIAADPALRTSESNRPINLRRADALLALLDAENGGGEGGEAARRRTAERGAERPPQTDDSADRWIPRPAMLDSLCDPTALSVGMRADRPALVGSIAGQVRPA